MKEEIKQRETKNISETDEIIETTENVETFEEVESDTPESKPRQMFAWLLTIAIIALVGIVAVAWMASKKPTTDVSVETAATEEEHSENESGREVKLEPETLASANLEYEAVTQRPAVALLNATGIIETNPQLTQSVTPLVGGRVERMTATVGDHVRRGSLLAIISSPQIAQIHGKMHEAETALGIAERNLARVQKAENRVAVLSAKAKLDESEASLKRVRRLNELGAGAGKDIISAETNYKTAQAEYEFQTNISLNKEIQEAKAAAETARVDLRHIRDEMRSLGVELAPHNADNHQRDTSLVSIYAPAAGMVTERPVNPGAGIETGTTLFVLSNLSSVYAVANVPEAQMTLLQIGTTAEIRTPAMGGGSLTARITYIDPQLNEDTRTGRIRLEVPNPNGRLRAGMFVEVGFHTGTNAATGEELVVRTAAIQNTGGKSVVFVPREGEAGAFEVREVETGLETGGYTRIKKGLQLGETVVTKGSFTLKTQLEKGAIGDDH
ncbi:MAG: efflux RND transporter periplasmic adaptor subunit [Pyrinomonadaceae bacterium]|nr:efflux RND transporter periplasmic adaptor subunit [Pyrinomonadaceae bacterium]